jgi:hypothetical protein
MVARQIKRLCRNQQSAVAWGRKTWRERVTFDCFSDVTLSVYMWFCAAERIMEDHRINFWRNSPINNIEIIVK